MPELVAFLVAVFALTMIVVGVIYSRRSYQEAQVRRERDLVYSLSDPEGDAENRSAFYRAMYLYEFKEAFRGTRDQIMELFTRVQGDSSITPNEVQRRVLEGMRKIQAGMLIRVPVDDQV